MQHLPEQEDRGHRLTRLYVLALGTVALLSILGQVLVQAVIAVQEDDSKVINVAGRQRMLSQQIAKSAIALAGSQPDAYHDELAEALKLWMQSHAALHSRDGRLDLYGENSERIKEMYAVIEPPFEAIAVAARDILSGNIEPAAIDAILVHEPAFLQGMDAIVSQYELEAKTRVNRLRRTEFILLSITLCVLLLEALFVFRPAVRSIQRALRRLGTSERDRETIAAELSAIFDSVPAVILYHDLEGKILRVNKSGAEIIGESLYKLHRSNVYDWFPAHADRFREEDERVAQTDQPLLGLLRYLRNSQGEIRWLRMNKVPYRDVDGKVIGILLFAVDVSAHKRLERKLMELRAEEERRLSYNLHDGLGQHLSGILYLSRTLVNQMDEHNPDREQAAEIIELVKQSIATVRGLSKSLRPIGDEPRALAEGLAELAQTTQQNTGIACNFEEIGKALMFETDVAEHLYWIAQEAVNNAVRHAQAKQIDLLLSQSDVETVVEVRDDGVGFETGKLQRARLHGRDPEGLGMSIMEHRSELAGGRLTMVSRPGSGTAVRCIVEA
jgi:PAS domain S-box-containing protein